MRSCLALLMCWRLIIFSPFVWEKEGRVDAESPEKKKFLGATDDWNDPIMWFTWV